MKTILTALSVTNKQTERYIDNYSSHKLFTGEWLRKATFDTGWSLLLSYDDFAKHTNDSESEVMKEKLIASAI